MSAAPIAVYFETPEQRTGSRRSLLSRARHGNRDAFTEMVSPYIPYLYQRARRVTGNIADAEDVRQEALLKAWSRLEQFSGLETETNNDFGAWVSRIAANTSIDLLRQRRSGKVISLDERRESSEETLGNAIPAREENPEERFARREMGQKLAQHIKRLPGDLRQACLLRDVLQYSTEEVAEELQISTVAVRLRLFRARRLLREMLQEDKNAKPSRRGSSKPVGARHIRMARPCHTYFLPAPSAKQFASGD